MSGPAIIAELEGSMRTALDKALAATRQEYAANGASGRYFAAPKHPNHPHSSSPNPFRAGLDHRTMAEPLRASSLGRGGAA